MKLNWICATFLTCVVFLFACESYAPAEKKALTNARLYLHKQISGTRVFMIPPSGFVASDSIAGFIKGIHASISASDIPNANFYKIDSGFSKTSFKKQGMEVLSVKEKSINGTPAKMILMDSAGNHRSYKMLFGDSSFATIITGRFPNNDEQTQTAVIEAMEGIWFDKYSAQFEFILTPYYVKDNPSKFKYLKTVEDTLFYTIKDERYSSDSGSAIMLVTYMSHNKLGDVVLSVNKMFNKIAVAQGARFRPGNPDFFHLENKNGCEHKYEITKDNKTVLLYSLAIAANGYDVVIGGVAKDSTRAALREYRNFAAAIQMKKE